MQVVREQAKMGAYSGGVLVPTMGALHQGHLSLVRAARKFGPERAGAGGGGGPVVVSIFVNPTQFGPSEDFARYPRTLETDLAACEEAGAEVVFVPPGEVVYPAQREIRVPRLPPVATEPGLEDAARPGHFAGVCQVVLRLFDLVRPRAAVFGEKDWQQLKVIEAMTAQERLAIEIVPAPTVREADGLAMSSRNRFLSAEDRRRGLSLSRALCEACGGADPAEAEKIMRRVLNDAGVKPDYAVVGDATSLRRTDGGGRAMRALVAAHVGSVRLIDNAPWEVARVSCP